MGRKKATERKITVMLPTELVDKAQRQTGAGLTATLREGLRLVAATGAYEKLRSLRGRVKLSIDLDALREDRS